MTPTVVMLTDGRANIALDGSANRRQAATDASRMAQVIRARFINPAFSLCQESPRLVDLFRLQRIEYVIHQQI